MDWSSLLSQPITQLTGLVVIVIGLQKAGVDIGGLVRTFLKMDEGVHRINEDGRNSMQELLTQMEVLSTHYNHETTEILTSIKDKLGEMHDCLKKANSTLQEFKEYGVKSRE